MKLPRPIGDAEYERRLNRLIEKFAPVLMPQRVVVEGSQMSRLYDAYVASPEPLSAREAWLRAQLPAPRNLSEHRCLRAATHNLLLRGWLRRVDRVYETRCAGREMRGIRQRPVYRFAAVPTEVVRARRIERGMRRFLAAVDKLDAKHVHASCFASRAINAYSRRDALMVLMRAEGMSMQQIGDRYGITRERVRQIVERTVTRAGEILR